MATKQNRFSVSRVLDAAVAAVTTAIPTSTAATSSGQNHYLTGEAPPRMDHYRNVLSIHGRVPRPTLEELHVGYISDTHTHSQGQKKVDFESRLVQAAVKFGWVQGVLIRCMLNIWGVMLFLRLSWVIGQAGIGLGSLIIVMATGVTIITTISMCAICTNGEVKGGGSYYMISRSLGPEFGGSIGVIFSLANAVAVAMYTIGFAEAFQDVLNRNSVQMIDGSLNDIRIISCVTVTVLLGIALVGTQWESRAQMVLLVILLASIADFIIGSMIMPNSEERAKGFIGWNMTLMRENFGPDFRSGETFFSVFAVFFPSVTGILAGANISGDLKDPQQSIPLGSLLAIGITSLSYLVFALICGATVLRDATGLTSIADLMLNSTNTTDHSITDLVTNCTLLPNTGCMYGLHNNFQVMELISAFGPLIYAGIFAATLSSALASLVSAPKVFQALCNDRLFPYIQYFGKGFGPNKEPRRAYLLSYVIAFGCCLAAKLNLIAPVISNFFLGAYALINFSCFHASLARSPGFRPSFKYYNKWISLFGAFVSLSIMFTGHWSVALFTFVVVLALYLYVLYRKPNVNWGSSTQAKQYISALSGVYKLNFIPFHVKNYRPQLLILSGNPSDRPALIDFGYSMVSKTGLVICGQVMDVKLTQKCKEKVINEANDLMRGRKIKGFFTFVEDQSFSSGVRSMVQSVGIGKLRPNVVLMGFKNNWLTCEPKQVVDYFNAIHHVFDNYMALTILRLADGLDCSQLMNVSQMLDTLTGNRKQLAVGITNMSFIPTEVMAKSDSSEVTFHSNSRSSSISSTTDTSPKNVSGADQFRHKQRKGCVDVWWLYDDGGLTLLLPYLLTQRKQWSDCKLRVFALASNDADVETEKEQMTDLLSRFRINHSEVTILADAIKPPEESSLAEFDRIVSKWIVSDTDPHSTSQTLGVTHSEILALREKTNRHIRLRELLCQHSSEASLIVMTLPMPRVGTCSAATYMSWLEVLSHSLPPFLFIRGNQRDVLTFYS